MLFIHEHFQILSSRHYISRYFLGLYETDRKVAHNCEVERLMTDYYSFVFTNKNVKVL